MLSDAMNGNGSNASTRKVHSAPASAICQRLSDTPTINIGNRYKKPSETLVSTRQSTTAIAAMRTTARASIAPGLPWKK